MRPARRTEGIILAALQTSLLWLSLYAICAVLPKEIAGKLSDACKEDISIVEIELGSQKKVIYFAHENCFRILANGLKIYENDNGNVSKVAIPLGRDIYK